MSKGKKISSNYFEMESLQESINYKGVWLDKKSTKEEIEIEKEKLILNMKKDMLEKMFDDIRLFLECPNCGNIQKERKHMKLCNKCYSKFEKFTMKYMSVPDLLSFILKY